MLKEIRDQAAHVLCACVFLLPLIFAPNFLTCAWAGFGYGFIRELTEEGTPVTLSKGVKAIACSKLDLLFWTVGGMLAALLMGV